MEKLKIAIQKSGRLSEGALQLLKECGIDLNNGTGKLKSEASNFPLEVLFLRDDDIPQYVSDGVADLGIVGENVLLEKRKNANILKHLGFGKCRLSIAVPRGMSLSDAKDLNGLNIATSYPVILQNYLNENNVNAKIHEISGSVEIAPGIGLADAICDLVSSGSTLLTNGLKEVITIFKSEAVLISNNNLSQKKEALVKKILFRIDAVKKAKHNKYILLNAPNEKLKDIINIIPGMKSPTILPLAQEGWSSLHSVVNENDFWDIIENLKANGAQGILVVPIEKMVI